MSFCAGYLSSALKRYGNTVTIIRGGRIETTRAFVQPLRRRHSLYISNKVTSVGNSYQNYRLYIGDCAHRFSFGDGTRIVCKGIEYTVVASEEYIVANDEIYVWAILLPVTASKEDDYDVIN